MFPGQLHLTPLHATVQLRPELVHIDECDAARKLDEKADVDDEGYAC